MTSLLRTRKKSYDASTNVLTLSEPSGDVTVNATAQVIVYTITESLSGVTATGSHPTTVPATSSTLLLTYRFSRYNSYFRECLENVLESDYVSWKYLSLVTLRLLWRFHHCVLCQWRLWSFVQQPCTSHLRGPPSFPNRP